MHAKFHKNRTNNKKKKTFSKSETFPLRKTTTQNRQIFLLCFIMFKIKLYVCRILCENFIQIGQKMKKL